MTFIKPPKWKLYTFFLTMPMIVLAMNLILFEHSVWTDIRIWLISFPIIFIIGFATWYLHILYARSMERKYPDLNQSKKRIVRKAVVQFLIMVPTITFLYFLYAQFHIAGYEVKYEHLLKALLLGLSINVVFQTLYEGEFLLRKYRESREENETIQQLSLAHEYDTLKSQVNPHFLFNCFNTLSSLITEDKQKAEVFLDELSKVYRYLLRSNEDGISTLENEIQFINSYYRLLRTRHGEAVQLNLQIDKRYESYLLPSLSLQLLVENVVKHNALSKNKPLLIDIFTTAGNKLIVTNNLQRRSVKAPSNRVGLENIKAKYELLNQQGFHFLEDGKSFTVVLPLIWNGHGDGRQFINRKNFAKD
jgi:sensor histidine kinase YesM